MNYAVKNLKFYGLFLSTFFLFSIVFSGIAMAETSSHTRHGYVEIEKSVYEVTPNSGPMFVTIKGIGDIPKGVERERVTVIYTLPDESTDSLRFFSKSDGNFSTKFPISYSSQVGTYKVFVTFAGQVLGDLAFNVVRSSAYTPQDDTLYKLGSDVTFFEIDSESYTTGSNIKLTGIVESKYSDIAVTIKITSPNGNLVAIDQLTPSDDGTFSKVILAQGSTWKQEGQYIIELNSGSGPLTSSFDFIIPQITNDPTTPSSPISTSTSPPKKSDSVLTLQQPSEGVYKYNSNDIIEVPINGYLTASGKPVVGATINFIVNGFPSPDLSTKTGSNGFFQTYFKSAALDSSYRLHATYDGSTSILNAVSPEKSFTVSKTVFNPTPTPTPAPTPTPTPMQSTQPPDLIGPIVGIIIALMIAGIIAVNVRKNRNRQKPYASPPSPTLPSSSNETQMFNISCPNCSKKLSPPISDGAGQKCLSCGWHS